MSDRPTVELYKLGRDKPSKFNVASRKYVPFSLAAMENKSIANLRIGEGSRRKASLFIRNLVKAPEILGSIDGDQSESLADNYAKVWNTLKERGLSVLETVRKIDDYNVAVTNLSETGSVYDAKIDSDPKREPLPNDLRFLDISMDSIRVSALNQLEIADNNGVLLPYDGPFHIFVNNTDQNNGSTWKIVLLDLTNVSIYSNPDMLLEEHKETNKEVVERWLVKIEKVRSNIKELSSTSTIKR